MIQLGRKGNTIFGSLTWQKVSRVKLQSSNTKQTEGLILLDMALLLHLPLADGTASPFLTPALLSTSLLWLLQPRMELWIPSLLPLMWEVGTSC